MGWEWQVSLVEKRGEYRIFIEKPEERRSLGRPRRRWGIILKCIFKMWDGGHEVDQSGSGQEQVAGFYQCVNENQFQ
jgi:hypothetical protein